MYKKQITIGGVPGSGKTTCAHTLSKILDYEFYSVGNLRRKIAKEKLGVNINELNFLEEIKSKFNQSIDNFTLNKAQKLGITKKLYPAFKKLNNLDSDKMVDDEQKELGKNSEKIIIEGRLAWKFCPQSVKFYFDCTLDESAKRIFNDPRVSEVYSSLEETAFALKKRMDSDMRRYISKYGSEYNAYDYSNFDIIINTTNLSKNQIVSEVLNNYFKLVES